MSKLGTEFSAVQLPFLRYAQEAGWTPLSRDEALQLRGGENGMLLREVFLTQAQKLNPGIVDFNRAEDLARRIERVLPRIEGNLEAWEYLRGLKTVFVPEERRELNVCLLADRWEDNTYHVTGELSYYNGTHRIRLDACLFINGIPVLLAEMKAATRLEGMAEALDQVRRYHREGPELLALQQIYTLTHLVSYHYGPTWTVSKKSLFNWKDEQAGADYETLVKTFLHPHRVTRLLRDFILFTRRDDTLEKVILRPHQMRAVERVVHRAADPDKKRGLIWHTQGSGKTFTMITAAKLILENPLFENPTILMLVDRNELEAQLFGNLAAVGFGHVEVARSKAHLRDLLASDRRGLIVSMIHKFEDIPADLNTRHNLFVLVDEAHRTTGGDLGNYLMAALPNATYLGFTGTPIDQTTHGKGTFVVFGRDDPTGYLDKYSIAESIGDKTTVPLRYTLAPSELRVDRPTLEAEFLTLADAEGVSDVDELNRVLDKAVNLRNMLKNRERVDAIAQHVAHHYREVVEPMGYKAFLVGVDREACALYKDALDRYLPPEYSAVVYSPAHNDSPEIARFYLSDDAERDIRKKFRKPDELPKILIVTEKLLTGYDAPILYCMYLDKPMRDHVLLQAIARVNRPYEDEFGRAKPSGFVLDYVGIFEKLETALAFDSEDVKDVQRVVTDLELLKRHFAELIRTARETYLPLITGPTPDKATENVLAHFRDETPRQAFYAFYRGLADQYEILSPDAFLRPYIDDYDQLTRMYKLLRAAYDSVFVDRELTRKTARLVQEHTQGGAIQDSLEVYEINENLLELLSRDETSDTVKVFNLVKSIEQLVAEEARQAPYLLSIGERVEAIILAYQQRQKDTLATLEDLKSLIAEINQARREHAQKGLNPAAFAIYWMLNRESVPNAEQVAADMDAVFQKYPHWRQSGHQERDVLRELYGILLRARAEAIKDGRTAKEVNEITTLVNQIIKLTRQTE